MMEPEWCPSDIWQSANTAVIHAPEYTQRLHEHVARALLEAHQRGMEEAAALLRDHATISNGEALDPAVPEILAFISAKAQEVDQ